MNYYCPKCKSENIEVTCLTPIKQSEPISLDIAGKGSMKFIDALYTIIKYKGRCNQCGYTRTWSE